MASAASMLRRVAQESKSFPRRFVEDAASTVQKAVDAGLKRDSGGDRVLSGTTRRGRRVALKVNKKVEGSTVVTAKISPGPSGRSVAVWSWLEDGVRPHQIGTGTHPGTRAKRTWTAAASPAVDEVENRARAMLGRIV